MCLKALVVNLFISICTAFRKFLKLWKVVHIIRTLEILSITLYWSK